ncbi:MAG: hypothetical protein AB8G16_18625 [Gammaproteobacteria bacterium]
MADLETNSALTGALKQAQSILTLAYLTMVGVGMLYYHEKYSEFDINIFQYADVFYFLIAPFEDVFIFILSLAAVALFLLIYATDSFFKEKTPRFYTFLTFGTNKAAWSEKIQAISWPLTLVLMLALYAQVYGDRARQSVLESEPITIAFTDGKAITGRMIGKTNTTLFLLQDTVVKAIPLGSEVKEIIITSAFAAEDEKT